jgi:hypothetical protein
MLICCYSWLRNFNLICGTLTWIRQYFCIILLLFTEILHVYIDALLPLFLFNLQKYLHPCGILVHIANMHIDFLVPYLFAIGSRLSTYYRNVLLLLVWYDLLVPCLADLCLIYRNDVSESQFNLVLNIELQQIIDGDWVTAARNHCLKVLNIELQQIIDGDRVTAARNHCLNLRRFFICVC